MSKTQRFIQLQNLKAHYKNIVDTIPTYKFPKTKRKIEPSHDHVKKVDKQRYQQIYNQNEKLLTNLYQIRKRKFKQDHKNEHIMKSSRAVKIFPNNEYVIETENLKIIKKLRSVSPLIGSNISWNNHFKIHRRHQKNISRNSQTVEFSKESFNLAVQIDHLKKKMNTSHSKVRDHKRKKIESQRFFSGQINPIDAIKHEESLNNNEQRYKIDFTDQDHIIFGNF